ncbi:hypothetical protein [Clostridium sp. C8-1-8]|uniref:hypothetical protein n=1 Tax=Clostridium sp. C8-1-8 TaxID=2698831 RepID=UPI0013688132|nr:hypothetical protein [Clostridium sp. C8-1-8]
MKKAISPILGIGLLISVMYRITERFIMPIPNWFAIPLLLVAIILIIVGGFKTKYIK